jgi:hypothetical protein
LALARTLVENVLADVRQRIRDGWLATAAEGGDQDADTVEQLDEILSATAPNPVTTAQPDESPAADVQSVNPTVENEGESSGHDGRGDPDELRIDPDTFSVRLGDKVCRIGPRKEFGLIQVLVQRKGKACSHQMLRKEVWDDDASLDTIYQAVKSLRKLLKSAGIQVEIEGRNGNYTLHSP